MSSRRALAALGMLAVALGALACAGRPRSSSLPPHAGARGAQPARPDATLRQPLPGYLDSIPVRLEAAGDAAAVEVVSGGRTMRLNRTRGGWSVAGETRSRWSFDHATGVRVDGRLHEGRIEFQDTRGGASVIAWLPLERYVAGVVAAELSLWSAQPAELEAQAIAARTYAITTLRRRERERADPRRVYLWDGVEDQAYRGRFEPNGSRGERDAAARLEAAIASTRGVILMDGGEPADTRFHAACGGHTATLESVFPEAGERAPGVACAPCAARAQEEVRAGGPDSSRPLAWKWTASRDELARLARQHALGDRLTGLRPTRRDVGGRWLEVELEGPSATTVVAFGDVRRALGFTNLRSTRILRTWPRQGDPITGGLAFVGLGYGHGVGLCQEGTRDHARGGASSREILRTYYPHATWHSLDARGRPLPARR